MRKLLVIAPQNPYPATDGGKISIYYPLISFSKFFEVHFVFITPKPVSQLVFDHFATAGIKIYPQILNVKDTAIGFLLNFFYRLPYKFQKYSKYDILKIIENVIDKENIKIIWCNHAHVAWYALQVKGKRDVNIFLREHNIEYMLVKQAKNIQTNFFTKAFIHYQYLKTRSFEINCWKYFTKTYFISDSDIRIAEKETKNSDKLEMLYDSFAGDFKKYEGEKEPFSCIFTASLNTLQNSYNLKTFVNTIWKPFVQSDTRWKLYLTGNTDEVVKQNLGDNYSVYNILNCGFVDDIGAVIQSKKYFISPTFIGSGLRIKVLNAMSTGTVCLVTPIDVGMLNVLKNEENLMEFSDLEDFKRNLIKLESNESMYISISLQASDVAKNFTWNDYAVKVCNELYSI